jgi:hypothetical protein
MGAAMSKLDDLIAREARAQRAYDIANQTSELADIARSDAWTVLNAASQDVKRELEKVRAAAREAVVS